MSIKAGDFTTLAKDYTHRTGYSRRALEVMLADGGGLKAIASVAEVGAGTGKLTEQLAALGLSGFAVEPNDAMREEGVKALKGQPFNWSKGSAEQTGLNDACADWALMASSFHWADAPRALAEFRRVLRPGGRFTALWNPRDLERDRFHSALEANVNALVPGIKRKSSGAVYSVDEMNQKLTAGGFFKDPYYLEAPHEAKMTRERYLGAWRSVNDIQAQAGAEGFARVMALVEKETAGMTEILVPYRTRCWTVRRAD